MLLLLLDIVVVSLVLGLFATFHHHRRIVTNTSSTTAAAATSTTTKKRMMKDGSGGGEVGDSPPQSLSLFQKGQKSWRNVLKTSFSKATTKSPTISTTNTTTTASATTSMETTANTEAIVSNNNNISPFVSQALNEALPLEKDSKVSNNIEMLPNEDLLFKDPYFPADYWQSIHCDGQDRELPPPKGIIWKRPWQINKEASFLYNYSPPPLPQAADYDASLLSSSLEKCVRPQEDIVQGQLPDCWLAAAMVALCQSERHFRAVIEPILKQIDGGGEQEEYTGKFTFNILLKNGPRQVTIDDRLPTKNGRLLFMHSADDCTFWAALLEKAYAKLHGSYGALIGGNQLGRTLKRFTGTGTRLFVMRRLSRSQLLALFTQRIADVRIGRFCCTISDGFIAKKAHSGSGILAVRCYSILDIVEDRRRGSFFVKIRNPWSRTVNSRLNNNTNVNSSPKWEYVSPWVRGIVHKIEGGAFLMALDSFHTFFDYMEWWHCEDDFEEKKRRRRRSRRREEGEEKSPQIIIEDEEEEDEEEEGEEEEEEERENVGGDSPPPIGDSSSSRSPSELDSLQNFDESS